MLTGLYLLATGAWSLVSQLSRESDASIPVTVFLQGPRLLIVLAAVVALVPCIGEGRTGMGLRKVAGRVGRPGP